MDAKKAKISSGEEDEDDEQVEFRIFSFGSFDSDDQLFDLGNSVSPIPIKHISFDVIRHLSIQMDARRHPFELTYKDKAIEQIARCLPRITKLETLTIRCFKSMDHWFTILDAVAKCKHLEALHIGQIDRNPLDCDHIGPRYFDWSNGTLARKIRDIIIATPIRELTICCGARMSKSDLDILSEGTRINKTLDDLWISGTVGIGFQAYREFIDHTRLSAICVICRNDMTGKNVDDLRNILEIRSSHAMQLMLALVRARKQGTFKNLDLIRMIATYL